MSLFGKKKRDYVVIIGCSRLGATIAAELSNREKNVMVLDSSEDSLKKLPRSYAGQTYVGDAMRSSVLEEINIRDASIVIVVTHEDNINIMLAQMMKEMYGIEKVMARLYDPERDIVYKELGIETLYPAYLEARQLLDWFESVDDEEE